MTDQPSLQFSVEESVWFEKGQEVQELLSMSLEPEITIQEHDQYLSIRGALQLSGEYYPTNEDDSEDTSDIQSLRENTSVRTIDEVRSTDNGTFVLEHKFPVDITIPMSRVDNLDDVYVMVDSFDYEIPESGRIQLTAGLSISGISTDEKPKAIQEQEDVETESMEETRTEENNVEDLFPASNEFPTFEAEVRKEETQEPQLESEEANEYEEPAEEEAEVENQVEIEAREEIQEEIDTQEEVVEQRVEDPSELNMVEQSTDEGEEEVPQAVIANTNENIVEQREEGATVTFNEKVQDSNNIDQNDFKDENALYLTEIFASEGREQFSTLRMRIVQAGESIATLADSYDTTTSKLMQMNRLEDDHVQEGQLIYVPAAED